MKWNDRDIKASSGKENAELFNNFFTSIFSSTSDFSIDAQPLHLRTDNVIADLVCSTDMSMSQQSPRLCVTMCGRVSLSCVFLVIILILSAQVLAQRSDEDDDVCLVRIPIIILRLHSFHSTYSSIVNTPYRNLETVSGRRQCCCIGFY